MRPRFILLILVIFSLLQFGCTVKTGFMHTVERGETLWRICHDYGVDLQEVAELNNIENPSRIRAGSRLFIPDYSSPRRGSLLPEIMPASAEKAPPESFAIEKGKFDWPVEKDLARVVSRYGVRDGARHDGIDINVPADTPILASGPGRVVYVADHMRGYGRIIIVRHAEDFYTVYAHNKTNHVKRGDRVEKGEVIGTVGESGNATGSHLHFEVRKGRTVRNPLFFLP